MTRNEAAERLAEGGPISDYERTRLRELVDEALAAERRATVERIRHALLHSNEPGRNYHFHGKGYLLTPFVLAILDEEAAR